MGATYTRQSSYTDGDVITAAHTNDEFNQLLAAFAASTGHTHDGTTAEGGPITKLLGNTLTFGAGTAGTDITITFDGETSDGVLKWMEDEDYFEFSDDILVASTEKVQFRDTAIFINSSADGQLDLVADTEIQLAATTIDINGAVDISGNLTVGGSLTLASDSVSIDSINGVTASTAELNILDGVTSTASELNLVDGSSAGTIVNSKAVIYGSSGEVNATTLQIAGTSITATATELNLLDGVTASTSELNILDGVTATASELNLVDGITAGTVSASKAVIADSNKDISGFRNVTITGDLTVSGDDITMGTNTSGHLLIADGTNFNPTAVGDLSEISTVANDDVLLAVDTSGGGLKKITRSTLMSGFAVSGAAISNVVEDTSPQLGADLDTNSFNILIDDAHFIGDENGNEQIIFQTTASAVNQFDITNAATGNAPSISATGGDTNVSMSLLPKGDGVVILDGDGSSGGVSVSDGVIDIRTGTGNVAKVKFYCESSNLHHQTLQAAAHSAGSSAVLVLPTASGNLVGTGDTGTVTNTMLAGSIAASKLAGSIGDSKLSTISTAGKVALSALEIDGGTDIGADLATTDLIIVDDGAGGTNRKAALSRLTTFMSGQGFTTDDPVALAIALG